ncbi:hypothetical protein F511_25041 [Dorcoceras hygrometricum]|uniref:Uncharacterized protein n=1 Tax=Dorcoceras hygrometricum TaxID=472368 RepID=A0A2Z7APU7_9LAMI|nr:hypothetical protein F511_25041 [Dorcoceras hygrometricum]
MVDFLRFLAVDDADLREVGSVEFPLLRRFHCYLFWRSLNYWKKNVKKLQYVIVHILEDWLFCSGSALSKYWILPGASFRASYCVRKVALDSSREALSSYTLRGGCSSLERDRKVAVSGRVFVRAGFNQISRAPGCGNRCTEPSVYCLLLCAYTHYITCILDLSRIVHCVVVSYLVVLCCCFLPGCEGERRYRTLISMLGLLALMRRVPSAVIRCLMHSGYPAGRGAYPVGGAPGGG